MKKKLTKTLAAFLCLLMVFGTVGGAALAAGGNSADTSADRREAAATETASGETAPKSGETTYVLAGTGGAVEKILGDRPNGDLPVNLAVTYTLDGKEISPEALAGKSGRVTIRFDYENQRTEIVEVDGKRETLYVPYAVMTGMLLSDDVFSNVEVTHGKILNDGSRSVVVGLAFPGLREDLNVKADKLEIPDYVEVSADAKNFELGMTMTVATTELFGDLKTDRLKELDDLDGSLEELTDAMDQLMDGSAQLYDGLETLLAKSGELQSGVDQLAAGSASLKTGAAQLDEGVSSLQDGAAQVSAGLNTLSANSGDLNSGAAQVFNTLLSTAGSQIAAAGLDVPTLTIGNYADVLNGVIASIDQTVYNTALEQVTAAVEAQRPYIRTQVAAAVEQEVTRQVTEAVRSQVQGRVEAAVFEAALPQITQQVTAAVREQVAAQVIQAAAGMSRDDYDAAVAAGLVDADTQAAVSAAIEQQLAGEQAQAAIAAQVQAQRTSEAVQAAVAQQTDAQMASGEVQSLIAATVAEKLAGQEAQALIDQNTETQVQLAISENMAGDEVQAKMTAASEQAKPLIALKASLDSYNAFYLGLRSYTAGVDQLAAGAGSLKAGADQLRSGSSQLAAGAVSLNDGIAALQGSTPALVDGVTQLRDGAKELSEGLIRFDEEGVQKLVDAVQGDAQGLLSRIRATLDAAKAHQADGKFIYRTDAIGE